MSDQTPTGTRPGSPGAIAAGMPLPDHQPAPDLMAALKESLAADEAARGDQ